MLLTLENTASLINKRITELRVGAEPADLYDPIHYIMGLGGKRLRPLLVLMAHRLYADDAEQAINPAMAVEMFHNYTLVHDDVMDNAPLRRGNPTVHEKWGTNIAILSGDVMLVKAYELMMQVDDAILRRVLERFNTTSTEICDGQALDMLFEKRGRVTVEEYIEMIRLKTAVLLGFSLELGALIAGADDHNIQKLNQFGTNMGIGFQLMDDLLDVYGDQSKFGKTVGGDIVANKKTYLLIKALELAQGEDKKKLDALLANTNIAAEEKVKQVTAIYDKLNIRAITEEKINEYVEKAKKDLQQVEADLYKKAMLKDYLMKLAQRQS